MSALRAPFSRRTGRLTIRLLLGLLLAVLAGPARAAAPAAAPPPAAAAPARPEPPSAAPSAVPKAQLEQLVSTLKDESARAKLVEQLQGLIAAQGPAAAEEAPSGLLGRFSAKLQQLSDDTVQAATVIVDAPRLLAFIEEQAADPFARSLVIDAALKLAVTLGAALLAEWGTRRLLHRTRQRLAARPAAHGMLKFFYLLLCTILDALPILAFTIVAYAVLPWLDARYITRRVVQIVITAALTARVILVAARAVLMPDIPGRGLLDVTEETASYLYVWARRLVNFSIYSFATLEALFWLGMPGSMDTILRKLVALLLTMLVIIFILQNRSTIAGLIRGDGTPRPSRRNPARISRVRVLRGWGADVWHVLAIIYAVGCFAVYALDVQGGFGFVARATGLTILIAAASRLVVKTVERASRRGFAISRDLTLRFPLLEARANLYLPVLTATASMLIYLVAWLALLQVWGAGAFSWFTTDLGRRMMSSVVTIGAILLVSLVLWEIVSASIERYLTKTGQDGSLIQRSARIRTLLPLLRNAAFLTLLVVVVLLIMSELGINIAPLLAGAGVIGLAIGFGSQALVKDVITGLFILIEDTVSVGDVVDLGGDHSGVIEAISIRAIRLRDQAGTVHTVPFSNVGTVKNLTKDYAYYVLKVQVSYGQDTDAVVDLLRTLALEMRAEPEYDALILQDLDVLGVDQFTDTAVVILARIKTLPIKQWIVGREFNRRMRKAFREHGILVPGGSTTISLDEASRLALAATLTAERGS